MAKLGIPLEGARRASLRGAYYTRTWRGIIIAQSQDRPSKRRLSPRRKAAVEALEASHWAIRYTHSSLVAAAMDATRGSLILWRDLLTAQMAGTLTAIDLDTGRTVYPDRYRRLVAAALDRLDMHPAGLLMRDADRWHIVPWGPAGTVLTSRGPGMTPAWR